MSCLLENRKKIFQSLIRAYWLRPESALWYSHMLAEAKNFEVDEFNGKTLDFGCMDGINSYVLNGGLIPLEFDVFDETKTIKSFESMRASEDFYDEVDKNLLWNLTETKKKFDWGLDWKETHLRKTARSLFALAFASRT